MQLPPPWEGHGPSFEKKKTLESSSPKDALCQVWLKMAKWSWRIRFLKVLNVFLLFPNYLPFEKNVALHLNKFECPSFKNALYHVWLKLDQWFWRRRFFKSFQCILTISQLSRLWEGRCPSLKKTLNSLHPRMLCA